LKDTIKVYKQVLGPLGFSNKKKEFFREGEGVTVVVELQKSNYNSAYYVNVGAWLTELGGPNRSPKEHKCHLRFRADSEIQRREGLDVADIFVLEACETPEGAAQVAAFLEKHLVPLVRNTLNLNDIRAAYREGFFPIHLFWGAVVKGVLEGHCPAAPDA
jgi:hypothetical protein